MLNATGRYRLGSTRDGGVVFWQIDLAGRVRDGKIMFYAEDCHRDHNRNPTWVSTRLAKQGGSPAKGTTKCLFGLHLLADELAKGGEPPIVAIVESEKTAVIMSELYPTHGDEPMVWLAAGGQANLSLCSLCELFAAFGITRKSEATTTRVILFPDTDIDGDTYRRWREIADKAKSAFGQNIMVSDILEKEATFEQKLRKIDLADLYLEDK